MFTLPRRHQEIVEQLDLMLRARYPPIYIVDAEEEPIDFLSAITYGRLRQRDLR